MGPPSDVPPQLQHQWSLIDQSDRLAEVQRTLAHAALVDICNSMERQALASRTGRIKELDKGRDLAFDHRG